jgi:general secretion pathway protein G
MNSRATTRDQGFTLIEMMVVISIILILLSLAMPLYSHSIARAREENLRHNLDTLNEMIFQYTLDKQKAPQGLDDLRMAKYLTDIPEDITGSVDTWQTEPADGAILSLDQTDASGIIGVHSGSNQVGSDGKAYSEW